MLNKLEREESILGATLWGQILSNEKTFKTLNNHTSNNMI